MVAPAELARAHLLQSLPEPLLSELARRATISSFRAGDMLFREGDPAQRIHLLRSGEVELVRPGSAQGPTVLARCRPGDSVGALTVLTGGPRAATAIGRTDGDAICLEAADVESVLLSDAAGMRSLLAGLAGSLIGAGEELSAHNRVLEQRVRERTAEVRETHLEVLRRLGEAVESRDDGTGQHVVRMSRMAADLAGRANWSSADAEMVLRAAPLHDIGKIGVPDEILRKPGRLTRDERATMETHTTIGAHLLCDSRSPVVRMAETIALCHHERWDGLGYPRRLAGEAIPAAARVCAIVDVFDALVTERPYKRAWSPGAALAEILEGSGTAFDPGLVAIFARHFDSIVAAAVPPTEAPGEASPPAGSRRSIGLRAVA